MTTENNAQLAKDIWDRFEKSCDHPYTIGNFKEKFSLLDDFCMIRGIGVKRQRELLAEGRLPSICLRPASWSNRPAKAADLGCWIQNLHIEWLLNDGKVEMPENKRPFVAIYCSAKDTEKLTGMKSKELFKFIEDQNLPDSEGSHAPKFMPYKKMLPTPGELGGNLPPLDRITVQDIVHAYREDSIQQCLDALLSASRK